MVHTDLRSSTIHAYDLLNLKIGKNDKNKAKSGPFHLDFILQTIQKVSRWSVVSVFQNFRTKVSAPAIPTYPCYIVFDAFIHSCGSILWVMT